MVLVDRSINGGRSISNAIRAGTDVLLGSATIVHSRIVGPVVASARIAVVPIDAGNGLVGLRVVLDEIVVIDSRLVCPGDLHADVSVRYVVPCGDYVCRIVVFNASALI